MRGAAIYSAPFAAAGILRRKCFSDLNGGLPREGSNVIGVHQAVEYIIKT